jgi:ankyrin repeat protein
MVQLLLHHHADPEQQLGNSDRPLHLYAERGDIKVLKVVLRHGVEVDSNPGGFHSPTYKPLHYAARCSVNAVKRLLEHGVDVKRKGRFRDTALYVAAREGNTDAMRLLMERWPEVLREMNQSGYMPMDLAAQE